jgi:hypothetical protein
MITTVPGNHDIGLGDGIREDRLERFQTHFTEGNTSQVIEICNFDLVMLDDSSMLNTQTPSIHDPPFTFLDTLSARPSRGRILFTHIPLWRPSDEPCGSQRESSRPIRAGGGHQYQNVLSHELSSHILEKAAPVSAVFAGDDHDYCLVHHTNQGRRIPEYTVKSFSWAMVCLSSSLTTGHQVPWVSYTFVGVLGFLRDGIMSPSVSH